MQPDNPAPFRAVGIAGQPVDDLRNDGFYAPEQLPAFRQHFIPGDIRVKVVVNADMGVFVKYVKRQYIKQNCGKGKDETLVLTADLVCKCRHKNNTSIQKFVGRLSLLCYYFCRRSEKFIKIKKRLSGNTESPFLTADSTDMADSMGNMEKDTGNRSTDKDNTDAAEAEAAGKDTDNMNRAAVFHLSYLLSHP